MKLIAILPLFLFSFAQAAVTTITQCDPVPTNIAEQTPYTTITQTIWANGKEVVAVIERYRATEYSENCQNSKTFSEIISHHTVTIF